MVRKDDEEQMKTVWKEWDTEGTHPQGHHRRMWEATTKTDLAELCLSPGDGLDRTHWKNVNVRP